MKIEWDIQHFLDKPESYRTCGLERLGSLDIEIALPLYLHEGTEFINNICAAIQDGLKIEDGLMVENLFKLPVFFFKVKSLHGEDLVYRVIFPDEKGYFPWDMNGEIRCAEPYRSQIFFEKDKVFWLEISDCEKVERHKKVSVFEGFEKRNNLYTCPIMYFVGGNKDGLVRIPPYMNEVRALQKCYQYLQVWREIAPADIKIICRDLDSTDPLNKSFCEWKERFW